MKTQIILARHLVILAKKIEKAAKEKKKIDFPEGTVLVTYSPSEDAEDQLDVTLHWEDKPKTKKNNLLPSDLSKELGWLNSKFNYFKVGHLSKEELEEMTQLVRKSNKKKKKSR